MWSWDMLTYDMINDMHRCLCPWVVQHFTGIVALKSTTTVKCREKMLQSVLRRGELPKKRHCLPRCVRTLECSARAHSRILGCGICALLVHVFVYFCDDWIAHAHICPKFHEYMDICMPMSMIWARRWRGKHTHQSTRHIYNKCMDMLMRMHSVRMKIWWRKNVSPPNAQVTSLKNTWRYKHP